MSIRPLPQTTVNLMVAGEAIDSLAAAVRELVENSLDAGAKRVAVEVSPERWMVKVIDDGCGISPSELNSAALPYCTSKLQAGEQSLHRVKTLGFRGKALHSLAQVSQLEIRSFASCRQVNGRGGKCEGDRHLSSVSQLKESPEDCNQEVQSDHGWLATFNRDGTPRIVHPTAAAKGTTVTASDLFANWPERRTALGDRKGEVRRIHTVLQEVALAHPSITWSLQIDGKTTLELWPGNSAADLLPQMVHRLERSQLTFFSANNFSITLGLPDRYHRPRPDWLKVAVNGRFVRLPQMVQAIQSAFHRTIPRDRHPLCIVHLQVPPEVVDWNRHPAKTDLYLQDLEGYCDRLRQAIQSALADYEPSTYEKSRQFLLNRQPASTGLKESPGDYSQGLGTARVLGQLQNTYVLVETSQGLWLVEQHVAHERVQYEQLQKAWELVMLPEPLLVKDLGVRERERLEELGIQAEEFGDRLWAIRQLPKLLMDASDTAIALQDLASCANVDLAKATLACRTAIQNGTPLQQPEMEQLIQRWKATQNPHTCPHGRPIYLALNESDLARFFRRNWMVCSQTWENPAQGMGDRFSAEILHRPSSSTSRIQPGDSNSNPQKAERAQFNSLGKNNPG